MALLDGIPDILGFCRRWGLLSHHLLSHHLRRALAHQGHLRLEPSYRQIDGLSKNQVVLPKMPFEAKTFWIT
jgi:hypothetical protein